MEVTNVELDDSFLSTINSKNATYTQVFRVELSGYSYLLSFKEKIYAEFLILKNSEIPQDYDQLIFEEATEVAYENSVFRCTGRDVKRLKSGDSGKDSLFTVWFVTITFTANVGIVTGAVSETTRLVSIDRGFQPYDFSVTKSYRSIELFGDSTDDAQGDPTFLIENTAGDPPSEGLTTVRNISWLEIELEYKEEYFDTKWLTTAFNTVNLFATTVCDYPIAAAAGKLTLKDAQMIISGTGQVYWIVKLLVEIKEETWITEWLDSGFNQLNDNDKSTPILKQDINSDLAGTNTGKEKVDDSQKLDGSGKLLASGLDPEYLEDLTIFPQDWTVLDLPTSLKGV